MTQILVDPEREVMSGLTEVLRFWSDQELIGQCPITCTHGVWTTSRAVQLTRITLIGRDEQPIWIGLVNLMARYTVCIHVGHESAGCEFRP